MIAADSNELSMVLMHLNIRREVGVKTWLVGRVESKYEVRL